MDLPVVEHAAQKRPSLKVNAISDLVKQSSGQEQALYVLLAATGLRISEALALETHHFTNDGRTINVQQQVEKDHPRVVKYLKTAAANRQVDLHPDIAEYLQRYADEKTGLLFHTGQNGIGPKGNGLELVQALSQDVVARSTLFGRHQQLLDGAQTADHVRDLLSPS